MKSLSVNVFYFFIMALCLCAVIVLPAQAQIGGVPVSGAPWWRNGSTLDLDFYNNRYRVSPTTYVSLPAFITGVGATFTRASSATYINSSGVMQTAAANTPRLDYDPTTLQPKGLLLEEGRTNLISNSTIQGAAIGTPGTLPTGWAAQASVA